MSGICAVTWHLFEWAFDFTNNLIPTGCTFALVALVCFIATVGDLDHWAAVNELGGSSEQS